MNMPERNMKIRRLIAEGYPLGKVAEMFGLGPRRVMDIFQTPPGTKGQERNWEMVRLVSEGHTIASIARRFGVHPSRVYTIVERLDPEVLRKTEGRRRRQPKQRLS